MSYSTTQREACYKIKEGQTGRSIYKWFRSVQVGEDGTPDIVTFEAFCKDEPDEQRCDLVWDSDVSEDGKLVQNYSCSNVSCDSTDGCTLQYSRDDEEWFDVTADEPPATEDCYFRCRCSSDGTSEA